MKKYDVTLTFTEALLGTVPKSKEVYADYVASKAEDLSNEDLQQELATVESVEEKGWTGFHVQDGRPILYNYVIKGFFKDACGMLRRAEGTRSFKMSAYKVKIDGLVFVEERRIPLVLPAGGEMDVLERPLRAMTKDGPRVALARSDTCPSGTTLSFTLMVVGENVITEDLLLEWLDYGQLRGLGQWRNAGYGAFSYEIKAGA